MKREDRKSVVTAVARPAVAEPVRAVLGRSPTTLAARDVGQALRDRGAEYGASKASISNWIHNYREECQDNDEAKNEYELMQEVRKLRQQLEEAEKENRFLKKAAAFFAKEID